MSQRIYPGGVFTRLRREASEALAEERATGDADRAWDKLRSIDREAWPAVLKALAQCAGLPLPQDGDALDDRDQDGGELGAQCTGPPRDGDAPLTPSGKLHPEIAKFLHDVIAAGLEGKLPPSWPEPTGHRVTWRGEPEPQAVAALYKAAVARGLVIDTTPTKRVAELFGVNGRTVTVWSSNYPVQITEDDEGGVILAVAGVTFYHHDHARVDLAEWLLQGLENAAECFRSEK